MQAYLIVKNLCRLIFQLDTLMHLSFPWKRNSSTKLPVGIKVVMIGVHIVYNSCCQSYSKWCQEFRIQFYSGLGHLTLLIWSNDMADYKQWIRFTDWWLAALARQPDLQHKTFSRTNRYFGWTAKSTSTKMRLITMLAQPLPRSGNFSENRVFGEYWLVSLATFVTLANIIKLATTIAIVGFHTILPSTPQPWNFAGKIATEKV